MLVHSSLDHLPDIPHPVVTMGSFDGVHAGHRVIISRLNQLARKADGASVLITFHPHPRKILYPASAGKNLRLISTLDEKCLLLEEAGLDHLVIMEFSLGFARTSSEDFVKGFLVGNLHAHTIVVGFNHYFGHNKEGSFKSLYRVREQFGFQVEEIPEQEIQHETVSSTKIRKALTEGNIQRANAYLEHHFMIRAEINQYTGSTDLITRHCYSIHIGDSNKLIPASGSYAVSLLNGGMMHKGLVKIAGHSLLLFLLDGVEKVHSGAATIHFHKQLISNQQGSIETELESVRELIY